MPITIELICLILGGFLALQVILISAVLAPIDIKLRKLDVAHAELKINIDVLNETISKPYITKKQPQSIKQEQ